MDITQISKEYTVIRITEKEVNEVYQLELGNPLYFKYCSSHPSIESVIEDLEALPPHKTYEDKFYIGFYKNEQLIAVMDLIIRYPNENTAFLGYFMVNQAYQGKEIGSLIIEESLSFLKENGFTFVRLGYMKGNEQSKHFWLKNGFIPTGIETNNGQGMVVVLQKQI